MSTITYAALAELAEAMSLPGVAVAHFRAAADDEAAGDLGEQRDARDELDAVYATLEQIPEPPGWTTHDDGCWRKHARCLADRILDGNVE